MAYRTKHQRTFGGPLSDDDFVAFLLGVWIPVKSSNVAAIMYVSEERKVQVEFQGKGGKPNTVYEYQNVDEATAEALGRAPSFGGAIWDLFRRPGYPYTQLV